MSDTVVIVTGAEPLHAHAVAAVPSDAIVIAADGGLDQARAAGLSPAGLVGDLDSITPEGLAWAEAHATIQRHDPDKDHTDTELAVELAASFQPERLILLGGGDRLDHSIAALGALGAPVITSVDVLECWWGATYVRVVHGPGRAHLAVEIGDTISLLAMHGRCTGVVVDGVRWPLDGVELRPLVGLGVSNEAVSTDVTIGVSTGVLTAFAPAPRVPTTTPGAPT